MKRKMRAEFISCDEASVILKVDYSSLWWQTWNNQPILEKPNWRYSKLSRPMFRKLCTMELAQKLTKEKRDEIQEYISLGSAIDQIHIGSNQTFYKLIEAGKLPLKTVEANKILFVKRADFVDFWKSTCGMERLVSPTQLKNHLHLTSAQYIRVKRRNSFKVIKGVSFASNACLFTLSSVNEYLYNLGFATFTGQQYDEYKFDCYFSEVGLLGNKKEVVTVKAA